MKYCRMNDISFIVSIFWTLKVTIVLREGNLNKSPELTFKKQSCILVMTEAKEYHLL